MYIKRIIFWIGFLIVLALILWGLAVAMTKQIPGAEGSHGTPAPVGATDHVRGPENAAVTLIEYSDFQCPACETYYPIVTKLLNEASTSVRFVYRHFPLPQHANAIPSAMASEAAGAQGKFWEMYDLIFAKHTDWEEATNTAPIFIGYATQIGLDIPKFTTYLKNADLRDRIRASVAEGQNISINATPSFFVNGKFITNPKSYADFKALIDAATSASTK